MVAAEVINREEELSRLLSTAESANNSSLMAPREYGKTSLLNKLREQAAADGWATVYVDFFGVTSLADVGARVEAAYHDQLQGDLSRWFEAVRQRFTGLRVGGGPVPASIEVGAQPIERGMIERLDMPRSLLEAHGLRTLVVFDEFQDVLEARDDADEVIRSAIQHHGESASYVFAGSELGLMRELFASRRRAFYRQADPVELDPLDPVPLGGYVTSRFEAGGKSIGAAALGALLDRSAGHPRAAMLLAHELWDLSAAGTEAGVQSFIEAETTALTKASISLRSLWKELASSDRGVLTKVARGEGPYARSLDGVRASGGTVSGALKRLEDSGELTSRGGSPQIVDPFLTELIRRDWSP